MASLNAFIGHSFTEDDAAVVRAFLKFFDQIREMKIGFAWEHAESAEPKEVADKVLKLMHAKNLFIGICTKKEAAIHPSKLTRGYWNKNILKASEESVSWKTSDWIIQEIGLAKGKGMDLILLVESGLRQPGDLQGNMESILFDREAPEKSFGKILEMIQSLIPRAKVMKSEEAEVRTATVERPDSAREPDREWLNPKPDWQRGDFEFALCNAIFLGEKDAETTIDKAYLATEDGQNSQHRESWMAIHEINLLRFGKGGKLTNLDELAEKHPENSEVLRSRAEGYAYYKEYEKAARYFENAAQKAGNLSDVLNEYGDAALAYVRAGQTTEVNRVIEQMKSIAVDGENGELPLLYTMQRIAEVESADDNFCSLTEKILDLRPADTSLRFNLAYKYSNIGQEDLSLYHYLKIPFHERSAVTWNNLGVQFEHFELVNKSVEAYQKSDELGETLAMSNLAQKFIKAGFLKEAEDICNRAIKQKDYHKNVGHAIVRIRDVPEIETNKKEEIVKRVAPIREFLRDYGHALAEKTIGEYHGRWQGKDCELWITIKGGSFVAEGSYEKSVGALGLLMMGPGGASGATVNKYLVRYQGSILGKAVKAVFNQSKEGESPQTFLGLTINEKTVLMIVSDPPEEIRVYEKDSKEENKFYKLSRLG